MLCIINYCYAIFNKLLLIAICFLVCFNVKFIWITFCNLSIHTLYYIICTTDIGGVMFTENMFFYYFYLSEGHISYKKQKHLYNISVMTTVELHSKHAAIRM